MKTGGWKKIEEIGSVPPLEGQYIPRLIHLIPELEDRDQQHQGKFEQ